MDFTALKTAIQNAVKLNGNEEITGDILQGVLLSMVNTLGDSAINDLISALANEVTNRQNADGTLQTNITNEATARGNADTALGTRIDNEVTARENTDTALSNRITAITDAIDNGYVYAGIATTSTEPATGKVFYLTTATGVFTNFGGITVNTKGIKILKKVGSTWTSDTVIVMDDTPTENSTNLVKSGGVYASIASVLSKIAEGYLYVGIATAATNPSTPTTKVFYIAVAAGTYTNFLDSGSAALVLTQGINILKYNGTAWSVEQVWGVDDNPTAGSNKFVKSGGVFNDIMTNGSAFDLSAYNNGTTYADLSAALTALNALPADFKKGGMSIKFVQSSDKNNYVQFRLITNYFNTTISNWQGVDDAPTAGSDNLVKSGGVAKELVTSYSVNLSNITQGNGYYVGESSWGANGNTKYTFINVADAKKVTIKACENSANGFVFLKSNREPSVNLNYDLATGETGRRVLAANTEQIYNVPSDCKYIALTTVSDTGVSILPQSVYIEYDNTLSELNLTNRILHTQETVNVFDINTLVEETGYYVDSNRWHAGATTKYAFVAIPNNAKEIIIQANALIPLGFVLLKSNREPSVNLNYDLATGETGRRVLAANTKITIPLSADCKYIAFTTYSSDNVVCIPQMIVFSVLDKSSNIVRAEGEKYIYPEDYGAIYDGITDCSDAINTAIFAASASGRTVRLCGGNCALVASPIIPMSDVSIILDDNFTIKLANNSNCPLIRNKAGEYAWNSEYVNSYKIKNFSLSGGKLDFNGDNQTYERDYTKNASIILADIENLVIKDITLYNPVTFATFFGNIKNFLLSNIKIDCTDGHLNKDGIHLSGGCAYGVIEHIYGHTSDDMIALNSGDVKTTNAVLRIGATHDIVVRDVFANNAEAGIRLLSSKDESPMYNITIDGLHGSCQAYAVALTSYEHTSTDGSTSADAYYKNIILSNIKCKVTNGYWNSMLAISNYQQYGTIYGENIIIRECQYHLTEDELLNFLRIDGAIISDIYIENCNITCDDIDLSSRQFILGNSNALKNVYMNNVEVDKPLLQNAYSYILSITPVNLLVSNCIFNAQNIYNASGILAESNIIFNGALR